MQTCPQLRKAARNSRSAIRSTSTSSSRMAASLPPSSRVTRARPPAAPAATARPVAAEPVNVTCRTPGCEARTAPSGSRPVTTVSTPSGRTEDSTDPSSRVASGVYGEGLSTTVLPAASAGANFAEASWSGKFHGTTAATGPSDRQRSSLRTEPSVIARGSGAAAAKWRSRAAVRAISAYDSGRGFPCSRVSRGARSAPAASTASAAASRAAVRAAGSARQLRQASCARATAASTSRAPWSGASPNASPVAGSRTANRPPGGGPPEPSRLSSTPAVNARPWWPRTPGRAGPSPPGRRPPAAAGSFRCRGPRPRRPPRARRRCPSRSG